MAQQAGRRQAKVIWFQSVPVWTKPLEGKERKKQSVYNCLYIILKTTLGRPAERYQMSLLHWPLSASSPTMFSNSQLAKQISQTICAANSRAKVFRAENLDQASNWAIRWPSRAELCSNGASFSRSLSLCSIANHCANVSQSATGRRRAKSGGEKRSKPTGWSSFAPVILTRASDPLVWFARTALEAPELSENSKAEYLNWLQRAR